MPLRNRLYAIWKRDVWVRIVADIVLVHLCMLIALFVSVLFHARSGGSEAVIQMLHRTESYYGRSFIPLSLLFPLCFLLNGFYTRSRGYAGRYKALVIVRGTALSVLVFLGANFMIFREELIARSAALTFGAVLVISVLTTRLGKAAVAKRFSIRPKKQHAPPRPNHVLVVGGAGYIGSMLIRRLVASGYRVRILDSLIYGDGAIRAVTNHPNVELQVGDCRSITAAVAAVKGVDSIIHLAAIVGDPACELDPQTALEVNYAATRMLVEVAKGEGVQRFIFASSCSVYGATDVVMDENSEVLPISVYGETKVNSEKALLRARTQSFHPTVLRLATVFGNSYRPRFDLVVNLLTARAYQEGVVTVFNGQQWRPFVHVHDVATGIVRILESPISVVSGEIFNVGDSSLNCTLSAVADRIADQFPNVVVKHIENSDRRNYRVSFDKIRNRVGFKCTWSIAAGVTELKQALESGAIGDYTDISYNNQRYLQTSGIPGRAEKLDEQVMAAFAGDPR